MTSKVQGNVSNYSVDKRGFARVAFKDSYLHSGYLSESSALGNVWLGVDDADLVLHLSRDNVRMLLPFLQNFANDGTILGDNWESEQRRLAADGSVEDKIGGSSDDEEESSQTRKRQRSDDDPEPGMVCAIKAPIPETKKTEEETTEK